MEKNLFAAPHLDIKETKAKQAKTPEIKQFAINSFMISDTLPDEAKASFTSRFPFIVDGVTFAICTSGWARTKINFKEYMIERNSVVITMPHFMIETLDSSENFSFEFLVFTPDFLSSMPQSPNFDIAQRIISMPCLAASDEQVAVLRDFHSFILKQYNRANHIYKTEMAKNMLLAMLAELAAMYYTTEPPEPASRYKEELMIRFFKLLLAHHQTERNLQFYADKMCLTTKYLSTVIKSTSGRTAMGWINEAVMASAKYMLKTTDYSIARIADELHFPNASFFGRFFKNHFGTTPLAFRCSR